MLRSLLYPLISPHLDAKYKYILKHSLLFFTFLDCVVSQVYYYEGRFQPRTLGYFKVSLNCLDEIVYSLWNEITVTN